MNCPTCNIEMTDGTVTVRGTLLGFLAVGMSHQNLYFNRLKPKNVGDSASKKIVGSGNIHAAYHCEECGLVAIPKT